MAVNRGRIDRILDEEGPTADTSLRAKSLSRASGAHVPRTLTPFEWQQWYALHGVPEEHQQHVSDVSTSWWNRFFRRR